MEQGRHGEGGGGALQLFEQKQRVFKHVPFGVKSGRLLDALHGAHFGKNLLEQPGLIHQAQRARRPAFREDLHQFVAYALGAGLSDERRHRGHGLERLRGDAVIEPGRKADGA